MRIAILADTHGTLLALDAVLADMAHQSIDHTVCLGDICGLGPQPRETLARIRELACPVVMGNADEFMLDPSTLDSARHPEADEMTRRLHEMERWCAAQLTTADLDFIRSFQ